MVAKMRAQRIANRIQEELSKMLIFEVADPRLEGVSVTDVVVDRELEYANIYVSALEGSSRAEEILEGCGRARSYLRSELAARIALRTFPRLRFHWDPTFERAERIEELFALLPEEQEVVDENLQDDDPPQSRPTKENEPDVP